MNELLLNENNKLKYLAYLRKSSEDVEKQVLSIESQRDEVKGRFPNLNIVEFLDEEKSAFIPYNRTVFREALERIKQGKADALIAWHPDRLSRNEIDAAEITYLVRTGVIKDLKFCSYTFQNSNEGIMMLQMTMSQSQYFSSKLGTDVKRGVEKKIRLGWWPGMAPVGYLNYYDSVEGVNKVIPDSDRFPVIRKAWEMMLSGGYTVTRIWKILKDDLALRTIKRKKIGGTPLAKSGLYRVLTNPFYAGLLPIKGKLLKGSHKPMITMLEFDHVQKILGKKGKPRPKKHLLPFTGVLRCGECGCQITGDIKCKLIKSTGEMKFYTYYKCTRKKIHIDCSQKSAVKQEDLDTMIKELLDEITIIPEFRDFAVDVIKQNNEQEKIFREKTERNLHISISSTQEKLDRLIELRLENIINDEEFKAKKEKLTLALLSARKNLDENFARAEKWMDNVERVFNFALHAKEAYDKGDIQTKKEILIALGQNPTLKDKKISITLNEWFVPLKKDSLNQKPKSELENYPKSPIGKIKKPEKVSDSFIWLRLIDDIRTYCLTGNVHLQQAEIK